MKYIFVRNYLAEIGIELTGKELDWFDNFVKGAKDLERYLLIYALCKEYHYQRYLEIGCAGGSGMSAAVKGGVKQATGVDIKIDIDPKLPGKYRMNFIKGDSTEIVGAWKPKLTKFDLIFIDGNHDYGYVIKDIHNSLPLLTKKGHLLIHDYGLEKGVTQAVDEYFAKGKHKDFNLVIKDNLYHPELEAGLIII